ncbi:hypothetical protein HYY69_04985 [Candidatus Woesearchaeota archaeon]|nr:hypothetical protein [Candidatus Woesearchaeota archaeon]
MNEARRNVPEVVLGGRRRRSVTAGYITSYNPYDDNKDGTTDSNAGTTVDPGLEERLDQDGAQHQRGTVIRRRRNGGSEPDIQRLDCRVLPVGSQSCAVPEVEQLPGAEVQTTSDRRIDQRKVENFKNFLTYILGSELRLVMVGYVLSRKTEPKTGYQKLKADVVWGRLENLVADDAARLYLSTHNNQGSVVKHLRDMLVPIVHLIPNSSSRSKPFFQLSVHGERYVAAAQYAYQWLAHHDLDAMSIVFSPKQDQKLPGPVCDVLFLDAIAQGCKNHQEIKDHFRTGATGFKGYDPRKELPDPPNLGHSVARRVEKYNALGYITENDGILSLTDKGKTLVTFIHTLYDLFLGDETAARTVARDLKSYKKDGVNPHHVLIPRYFEGNRGSEQSFIDQLRLLYQHIEHHEGEGLNVTQIYQHLSEHGSRLSRAKIEEGVLALAKRGYLVSHQVVKEHRNGAGRHGGTLHNLDTYRYTIKKDKPFSFQQSL